MNVIEILLQDAYHDLPSTIKEWHENYDVSRHGIVNIQGDNNFAARVLRRIFGLPAPKKNVKLRAILQEKENGTRWLRYFDNGEIHTNVTLNPTHTLIYEHLLGFKIYFKLVQQDQSIVWQFHHAKFLGIPCPAWLSPKFHAYEYNNNAGKYAFYVDFDIPIFGKIIQFEGSLY